MISVRPIQKNDLPTLQDLSCRNGQSYFLFESILPLTRTEREEIHLQHKSSKLEFLAETRTGIPVGAIKVDTNQGRSRNWGISFAFFDATEETARLFQKACQHFIFSLFDEYLIERLHTCTLGGEAPLHHLLNELGFQKEAELKQQFLYEGNHRSVWIFGLLKKEFMEKQGVICSLAS